MRFGFLVVSIVLSSLLVQGQEVDTSFVSQMQDRPLELIDTLDVLIGQHPTESLYILRAHTYEGLNRYADAENDYRNILELYGADESISVLLGKTLIQQQKYTDAIEVGKEVIAQNDKFLPAYHVVIESLIRLERLDEALSMSDATLKISPTAANYYWQAEVYARMKNTWRKAEWAYEQACELDPEFIDAYLGWAEVLVSAKKGNEVINAAEKAMGIDPECLQAIYLRSLGLALQGNYDYALDDISHVINHGLESDAIWLDRAGFYAALGRWKEVRQDVTKIVQSDTTNYKARMLYADAEAGLGHKSAAKELYSKLLIVADSDGNTELRTEIEKKLFELGRETNAPEIVIESPKVNAFTLLVADNLKEVELRGYIKDQSEVKLFKVGDKTYVLNDSNRFVCKIVANVPSVSMEAEDVYGNRESVQYDIELHESIPPELSLLEPAVEENNTVYVPAGSTSLYIAGVVNDASGINAIYIDGTQIPFEPNTEGDGWTFSYILLLTAESKSFSIEVEDGYGNRVGQKWNLVM